MDHTIEHTREHLMIIRGKTRETVLITGAHGFLGQHVVRFFLEETLCNIVLTAREKETLATLTYQGFRPSSDAQLVPIRQIELAKEKSKIETDSTLAAADKEKKLADVTKRLAELDRAAAATTQQ